MGLSNSTLVISSTLPKSSSKLECNIERSSKMTSLLRMNFLSNEDQSQNPFPSNLHNSTFNQQEKPFESISPTNTRFSFSFGTWQTSIKVLTTPLCIFICIEPILIDLQGASLAVRMLQSNYFSYVTNQCLCEHIDKYNLSPVLIVQNVPIVVRQQPEPNRFSMRSHFE